MPRVVTLFGATGCCLCERAHETLASLRDELGFELTTVEIDGDPVLEARYRELLPVVEIDGRRAFVYAVPADRFRAALAGAQAPAPRVTL